MPPQNRLAGERHISESYLADARSKDTIPQSVLLTAPFTKESLRDRSALRQVSTLPHRESDGVDKTSFWMYAAHTVE
jgi:hypothetical protein